MKICIMTDMEGVAGVTDSKNFLWPGDRYYEHACELVTLEVSAAVEGALEAGATDVLVVDGHGGGAIKRHLLHPKAKLLTGRPLPPGFTWGLDGTFNAAMIIGQHAMSNTDGGHLAHTMSFPVEEYLLNGAPIGEMGLNMLRAGYFGIPTVMVSGDRAACDEARALVANIEAVAVKEGIRRGSAKGLTAEENAVFNCAAIHLHPDEARARIREHAFRGVRRTPEIPPYRIEPPYTLEVALRAREGAAKGERYVIKARDFIDLMALRAQGKPKGKAAAGRARRAPAKAKALPKPKTQPARNAKKKRR